MSFDLLLNQETGDIQLPVAPLKDDLFGIKIKNKSIAIFFGFLFALPQSSIFLAKLSNSWVNILPRNR